MWNLVKEEFFQLSKARSYKLLLACSFAIGLAFGIIAFWLDTVVTGAYWVSLMGTGYMYNAALISIFAADYIGSEFKNHTFAGEISCGVSRGKLFWAKTAVFFAGVPPLILIYDVMTIILLTVRNGFGMEWNAETAAFIMSAALYSALCNFTMSSLILMTAFLVKNKIAIIGLGIGSIYMLSQWVIEARNPILLKLLQFTFIYQLDSIGEPLRPLHVHVPFRIVVLSSLVQMGVLLSAALFVFQKSDLR